MARSADIASPALMAAPDLYRALGFVIVAGIPAVFWSALVYCAGLAFGSPPSGTLLLTIAATSALFLSLVFAAISSDEPR